MKKLLALLIAAVFTATLSGCGGKITPEKAFSNLKDATQGTMAVRLKLTGDTDGEKLDMSTDLKMIFGSNKEKSKIGFALGAELNLGKMDNTMPSKISCMAKVYYDGTQPKKQLDIAAGIDKATAQALGAGLNAPVMITLNSDDLKSVLENGLEGSKTDDKTTEAELLKLKSLLTEQFNGFELPKPEDKGETTLELSGVKFTGNQYNYELTEPIVKDLLKRIMKFQNEATKSNTKVAGATEAVDMAEFEKSISELDLSKPSILSILVDNQGFIGYASISGTLKSKKEAGAIDFELAFGAKDLAKTADGTEYYKTTSEKELPNYKDAIIIPGSQISEMLGGM